MFGFEYQGAKRARPSAILRPGLWEDGDGAQQARPRGPLAGGGQAAGAAGLLSKPRTTSGRDRSLASPGRFFAYTAASCGHRQQLSSDFGIERNVCSVTTERGVRMCLSPSIVPPGDERDVYLVMNDFGRLGAAWCEAAENDTHREVNPRPAVRPVRQSAPGDHVRHRTRHLPRRVPRDRHGVGRALRRRSAGRSAKCLRDFIDRHGISPRPIQLSLPIAV